MRVIGLTGGIASGKSTVSGMLRELGARVIDADAIAREVVEPGRPARDEIVAWLGRDILLADGSLDRRKLGELVFGDSKARAVLEGITHPRITAAAKEALAAAEREGCAAAVLDVPLLYEAGWDAYVDEVWVVYVDAATQLRRLMERDSLTEGQAAARVAAQMSLEEKARRADIVIDNSGAPESTAAQVAAAWRRPA
ncbi:dephospho-CoA kinase [Anaeroselena agilis]|uniref:Dephospho-CoA kinase n=1 Tax=Anaeroselena agilis TaxID=3063788 RepID=A0ABU3NV81_9FIRM|nr:dephospho-CoA kinase [Selenomonadales bacterium 4137-cl]